MPLGFFLFVFFFSSSNRPHDINSANRDREPYRKSHFCFIPSKASQAGYKPQLVAPVCHSPHGDEAKLTGCNVPYLNSGVLLR